MEDAGYSTMIDAILFLAMVSACALILGMAAHGAGVKNAGDAGLRAMASATLASMERVKLDYFEYRILGDRADAVAERCGIDPGSWLYRETAKAVLGRGNRHKAVMEIAAEAAACQFELDYGDKTIRLNPLTTDYHGRAQAAVGDYLRGRLDSRYAYNFSLRWVPFAGVPFGGSLSCGSPAPPGAASASAYVTLPYRTGVTREDIESAISPDLEDIEGAAADYRAGGGEALFKEHVRASLGRCLGNASRPMVDEVLGNTLYEVLPANDAGNPLTVLAAFSDNGSAGDPLPLSPGLDIRDTLCSMVALYNGEALDGLAEEVVEGVKDGGLRPGEEKGPIIRWMEARYNPSRARATLSIWVRTDA